MVPNLSSLSHRGTYYYNKNSITLKLLRNLRLNPKLYEYEQLEVAFDFNLTSLGPLGCQVLVHELPYYRKTWAPHVIDGFYIGPALNN